jgi:hypothetical protein
MKRTTRAKHALAEGQDIGEGAGPPIDFCFTSRSNFEVASAWRVMTRTPTRQAPNDAYSQVFGD